MREIFKSQAMKKFLHNKKAMLGLAIVVLLVLAVLFIPLFKDMDPYTTDRLAGFNSKPSAAHPLGTDDVGRDLFARLLYGGSPCSSASCPRLFPWQSGFPSA